MATEILCTPVGMTTDDGVKRVNEALEDLQMATRDAANYFQQLWDDGAFQHGLNSDEMQEAGRILELRAGTQEEFVRAVAGAPPAKKGGR